MTGKKKGVLPVDVIQAIRERRSVRKYRGDDVPEDLLVRILECARIAPSAGNRQPWVFIAVKNPALKSELSAASGDQAQIKEAPVTIVVCVDPEICASRYRDRGRSLYVFQDAAAATQNILLAAVSFGLATCWVGSFDETKVRVALDLPSGLRPVTMISLGYPDEKLPPRDIRPFHEVVWRR